MHLLVISLHSNQLNFLFVAPKPQDIIKFAPLGGGKFFFTPYPFNSA